MGIDSYIDTVVTSVEHGYRKPHPSIYAEALGRLGVEASSTVFVNDNYQADYLGPKQMGMTAYHISSKPNDSVPEIEQLRSLADLPDRLARTR